MSDKETLTPDMNGISTTEEVGDKIVGMLSSQVG